MVITYVTAITSAENASKFEETIRKITEAAKQLNGCQKSEWYRDPDVENQYTMYGEFDSEESFALYKKSEVVTMIVNSLIPLTLAKPAYKHFRAEVFEQG